MAEGRCRGGVHRDGRTEGLRAPTGERRAVRWTGGGIRPAGPFPGPPAGWPYRVMGRWWRRSALARGRPNRPPFRRDLGFREGGGRHRRHSPSLPLSLSLSLSVVRARTGHGGGAGAMGREGRSPPGARSEGRRSLHIWRACCEAEAFSTVGGGRLRPLFSWRSAPGLFGFPFLSLLARRPNRLPPFPPPLPHAASHRILT